MINAINFVQRAATKKTGVFIIENGRIIANNDLLTASAIIGVPIDCKPKVDTFTAIIKASNDAKAVPSFSITPTGKLSVKAGKLRALIDCDITHTQEHRPEGIEYPINGEDFLQIIAKLEPFMETIQTQLKHGQIVLCLVVIKHLSHAILLRFNMTRV